MSKHIKQRVVSDATPAVIYSMLMDSRKHEAFTGAPARIGAREGAAISAHGGYISGFNVELVKNKRIVQAWRGADWPRGAWSIATFELAPAKGGKTALTFTQHGVPPKNFGPINKGWKESYWDLMKAGLGARRDPPYRSATGWARRPTARARSR